MRTSIYARKSNDERDKADEDKSVERQVAHAQDYIRRKGWQPAEQENIFVDDAISGAEFKSRPALLRMLNRLREFDVIVASEQSRFGREMQQTGAVFARIVGRGVRIFFYLSDAELKYETAIDKFMAAAISFGNEMERELAGQRARDAALKRATEGRNFGGRAFGYFNFWRLPDGTEQRATPGEPKPPKTQTIYRINADEARVVRAIYAMYSDGHGQKSIAFTLNGAPGQAPLLRRYFDGVRPMPPRGNAATWSPNTVHDILRNSRYLGFIPFGATRKRLDLVEGTTRRVRSEEQLFPAPELRIVPEPLAEAVRKRVEQMRGVYLRSTGGQLHGRPESGRASRYLLPGLVRCQGCGSSMVVSSYGSGSGHGRRQVRCYMCNFRSNRGPTACSNAMRPRLEDLDGAVLTAIEERVLTPQVVRAAAQRAVEMIRERSASQPDTGERLERDLSRAERERDNLVGALAAGRSKPDAVLMAIAEREKRIDALHRDLAQLEAPAMLDQLSDKRLERQLVERAAHWREALAGDPALARQALRALMAGPIWFVPQADGYVLRGATRLGALWPEDAADVSRVKMASPRGFEPRLPP